MIRKVILKIWAKGKGQGARGKVLLPTAYCLLLTAYCLLPTAYCLLPTAVWAAISTIDLQGGAYSSIKLTSEATPKPAVAYFDYQTGELKYSYWTGTQWIRTVVEEKGVQGYISLYLDSSNRPYISYYHNISKNNSTGTEISDKYGNHMVGALKYAYCSTVPCLTPENWTKVTVVQIGQSENGHTGGFTSLAFDSSGKPRIAYYDFSHKIDANDTKKGALKLAYCNSNCGVDGSWNNGSWINNNWSISTVDTQGGRSASMVIDSSNKVMLSYDADEVQTIRYAESSDLSSWPYVAIDTVVNTSNLFRDTSIAINPVNGKPRIVYQYQGQDGGSWGRQCCRGDGSTIISSAVSGSANMSKRDTYYAYCDADDCGTNSLSWTKRNLADYGATRLNGYTSSIKVGTDGIPRIAYHYWGHRANGAYSIGLAQDLHYVLCGNSACSSGNTITGIDGTNNTGLYSSIVLDTTPANNPFISYYDYDSNQLKLYHPGANDGYTDPATAITANVSASDTSNQGTGLQNGDTITIIFSTSMNTGCINASNIDIVLKPPTGKTWGTVQSIAWNSPTNNTLTITLGTDATVTVGDRISINDTCLSVILQVEIKGNTSAKPPKGAIAYYKMDEGAKMTAYDSAGGHNASLNKGVAWTTGVSDYGVSLDGSDDHLFAPGVPDIGGGKLTIEAWLKPNAFGQGYTVLSKENSYVMASNGQCEIATNGTTWAWYGAGSMSRLQRNYSGDKDIWRQVVCTYDGTTQRVYIDGIFDGSLSRTGAVSGSRYPFVMGRRELSTNNMPFAGAGRWEGCIECGEAFTNYTGTNYYNGKLDEVVIYNTALSQTEILNRFKELPAQLERADANDSSGSGYGRQSGDTIAVRFTNTINGADGENPPTIDENNIDTVLSINNGHSWKDGNGAIGSATWTTTRFTNDTLLVTLSTATSSPTVAVGDIITLSGGVIKEKTGTNSITGSTKIRGSFDLNGAVAYWNLDESSGDPSDSVGQYNNGTLKYTTTAPTYSTGKYNKAINLDGGTNSQYVEVSNYPDLNPTNTTVFPGLDPYKISVEAWAKSSASTWNADGTLVSKRNVYILYPVTGTKNMEFRVYVYADGSWSWQSATFTADADFDITQWHHYTGTYDKTNIKIYVDGILKETTPNTGDMNTSDTGVLTIGRDDGQAAYLNGSIDEVVIYNRAISADEVRKRASAKLKTAVAKDTQVTPQIGIQAGDTVVLTFDAPTAGTTITKDNIGTALALSNGHSWLDGSGNIGSAVWSTSLGGYTNDTLTITLSTGTSVPTVAVGDTITLGTTIKDTFNRTITGSIVIGGNYGVNLPTGGIAYYNFDEQSGTIAYDSIGNNHGTFSTLLTSSYWRTEKASSVSNAIKGIYIDGYTGNTQTRYMEVPDSNDFNLSSYTIDAYVKVPDGLVGGAGVVRRIISQDDGTNYWKLQLNDNNLEFCDNRLSTPCNSVNPVVTIKDGEWHHVAVVRDDELDKVILYVDGVATTVPGVTETGTRNISASVQIGRKYDGTEYFYGMIDEIVVYNRALTLTEVRSRYRAPIKSAFTSDTLFNSGIQSGDKVIIRFHGKTNGCAIDNSNIDTNLVLSNSHSWKDGSGNIGSAVWSNDGGNTNDTLTVTLSTTTSAPTIAGWDTITVGATSCIKAKADVSATGNDISDSFKLSKDFDFNLPEGAISYWKMENNNDSFGQNNITTNTGTVGGCKFNNCYTYGSNQYGSITNSSSLNPERITVEAWVNPGSSAAVWVNEAQNTFFFYGSNSVRLMGVANTAQVKFNVNVNDTWSGITYTPSSIAGWHHYVGIYDGANLRLYMDGVEVGTPVALSGVINQFDTTAFKIAHTTTGYNPSVSIDDVAVYNRALSAEEVLGRYGDYTVTARAYDTSGGGPNIQAGDTVTFKFSGPTNGAVIDASSCPSGSACIDNALFLSNLHTWLDCNGQIESAVWSSTGEYSNDKLTVTLKEPCGAPLKPDVKPLDDVSIGSPIGAAYRAFSKSAKIGGLFGDNLPASGNKVSYWNFDEQSGTIAYDSIGDNHGTLSTSFWRTERASSVSNKIEGLYFDGSRYVTVPDILGSNDFNFSSYTIEAYVKVPKDMTTTYGTRRIISQDNGGDYWSVQLTSTYGLELCDSRLTTPCNYTATTIDDGEWHHVAVVHDDAADTVKLYIDGVALVTNTAAAGGGTPHNILNTDIQIGRKYVSGIDSEYFYGMIDEIAVYNRALIDTEIQTRYRAPVKAAFTSDPYFNPGIQAEKDKVVIRFHGKTNVSLTEQFIIDNINTILPITGKPTGWGTIQGVSWSTYSTGDINMTNNTLTITLGTGATIAKGDTITTNGTYIKDMYLHPISDSITLGGDFAINLPEGAVSYWTLDSITAGDMLSQNSISSYGSPDSTLLPIPVFSYDFTGTTITNLSLGGGTITQNNQLSIVNNADAWDTYVYTNSTFARSSTRVFKAKFKAASGARAMIGWHDSGTGVSYADLIYAIYFNNGSFTVYEDGTNRNVTGHTYTVGTWYDVKIELKGTGAKYYYKLTTSQTWTLLYDSNYSSEATLRPGVAHYDVTEYSYTDDWIVEDSVAITCKFNGCYSFGTEQYTYANNSTSLNPERLSIEGWVKNNYGSNWNGDSYFFSGGNSAQLYGTNGVKTVNFRVYADGAWRTVSYTPSSITEWHHYIGIYDGTNLKLYMDGVLVGTTAYTGVINQFDTGTFYIGATGTGYSPYISIDDMVIYNRALTLEEVIGRYGEYSTSPFYITAFADDPAPDTSGIQAGDTVTIKFPGPTNGIIPVDANNIDNLLTLSGLHTWLDGSLAIDSAVWSTRVYENDTLTITLSAATSAPTVAPQDTISMGGVGELGAKYRAATWSAKISGTFGEPLPGTPVAFYKMDENIGNIAFDSVGTNDGTLSGTTIPAWGTGFFNYGLNFNSSTAYMNVGSITLSGDWSVEGWFNYPLPTVTGTYNSLTGDRRVVVQRSTMKLGTHNGTNFVDLDTPYVMSGLTSGWHHIAAVGDSVGNTTKFYIDSVLVGTANYETTATTLTTIGNITAGNEQFGLIDELAIYSSALSANEVAARYLVFLREIYAKDTTRGGANIQNGDQIIIRFDGATEGTTIDNANIGTALQLSAGSWGTITSADWDTSTTYNKTKDTLTITLQTSATISLSPTRPTITLGGIIKDYYGKVITGSMQIGGDFGTNLPDGVVAYYKLDDGTSGSTPTTATDSFNDNDGTLTNTPAWTTSGRFNNALQFTGGTGTDADYVSMGDVPVVDNINRLSVEFWMKGGATQKDWAVLVAKADDDQNSGSATNQNAWAIQRAGSTDALRFGIVKGAGTSSVFYSVVSSAGIFDDKWHHIAAIYNGTDLRIYKDGALFCTPVSASGVTIANSPRSLTIGSYNAAAYSGGTNWDARAFTGSIDDVVLYNRALSSTEVQTRYGAWFGSATAYDASDKGPKIQASDKIVIIFTGETNQPVINAGNINTILQLNNGHSWLGSDNQVTATWDSATQLTITLSGPAAYTNTTPTKPTVVVGDTITINGTIKDSSDRVIRDTITIGGSFGVSSASTLSDATASDASNKGPNIQVNDKVVIKFSGATCGCGVVSGVNTPIDASNIDTILPLSGGRYRKPITITGSTAGAQTNYQVLVTVDTQSLISAGKMQSTGADIRFYNASVELPYWIESGINTTSTKIWVKVDSIPASPLAATIYMYYGNPSASAVSNGNNVFEFFDNFESNTWIYSESGTNFSGTWATDSSASPSHSYKINYPASTSSTAGYYGRYTKTINVGTGTRRMKVSVQDGYTSTASGYHKMQVYVGGTNYYNGDVAGGTTAWTDTGWLDISSKTGSQSTYFQIYEQTGVSNFGIDVWWDNIIIRKYASSEPTAGTPGTEKDIGIHSWKDGNGAIVGVGWTNDGGYTNDTLTITLSGPPTYSQTSPTAPAVEIGDVITIDGTINDPTGKAIVSTVAIGGNFGVSSASTLNTAAASDASGKGPNIQANDTIVITFAGATNAPTIDADNINTILPLNNGHSWLDGSATPAIVSASWNTPTNTVLTITLSGPPTYSQTSPTAPTVAINDVITIDGTINDPTGKAIVSTVAIGGNFGVSSASTLNTAAASDASGKGPNIQANDTIVITFNGATCGCGVVSGANTAIDSSNINQLLPLNNSHSWLAGNNTIVSAEWTTTTNTNDKLTITLSGPPTYSQTSPTAPTVAINDVITIGGTINDSTGKAIVSTVTITGGFGVASTIALSGALASDASNKGPNIQANDTVVLTFSGATDGTAINSGNIDTILPLIGSDFSYDFTGTTIDTTKLDYGGGGTITQNDYLSISNDADGWDKYVYTDLTFARNLTKAFQARFKAASGVRAMIGWHDSGTGVSSTDLVYAIYFDNGTFRIYEDGTQKVASAGTYTVGTWYDVKIELKGTGAKYYYKLTASPTWTLLYDSNYSSETPLRAGVSHYDTNITYTYDAYGNVTGSYDNGEYSYTDSWIVDSPPMTWLDGDGAIVSASWNTPTNTVLTIALKGPANYGDPSPTAPTVTPNSTIKINGAIADASGKAIISNGTIAGNFGVASTVIPNTAVASDTSNWGPNIQSGDKVVITFSGATNTPTIDANNIDTVLKVNGKTWKDGNGAIGSAVWDSSTQLTVTLSGQDTQQDSTPTRPTVAVGDIIIIDGTITDTNVPAKLIIASVTIGGTFGNSSGTALQKAFASDDSGQYRMQAGDKVVITFNGQIGYAGDTCPAIDANNIDTVLALNNGHSWKDGSGAIGGVGWDSSAYQCGTLTITLSDATSAPTVAVGDTITLGGGLITDKYRTTISSSLTITGDLGRPSSAKAEWKLNSDANDTFNNYNGTFTNSGTLTTACNSATWTTGRFSNGLCLDGTASIGDYVTLATAYPLTASWTIEAWFKWPISQVITSQQKHTLISSLSTQNDDQIIIENQTKFLGTSDGNAYYYVPNYNLKNLTNGWHHVAAVGTGGSGTAGTTTFYIDGNLAGSVGYKSTESIKYIGNSYITALYNRPMTNTIDNIVIYDTALSDTTIKNRYGSWPRSAFAEGAVGEIVGIQTGDQVVLTFDRSTEGNTIDSSNIGTTLVLSSGCTWGTIQSPAAWSSDNGYTNNKLTVTLTTTGSPTIAPGCTITLSNNVIKDHAGRPISDVVTLQGNFDFKLPSGAIAYWRFNEGSGVTVDDSFGTNHANLPATVVDTFDTTESWTENNGTGSVVSGLYNFAITATADPFFYKNITDFEESYNYLEFTYQGYGANGPSSLRVYYTDGVDCTAYSETCAQSFTLTRDSLPHTIYMQITDAEWVDNDGIIGNLRFDLDGAGATGTFKVNSIKFGTATATGMWSSAGGVYGTNGVTVDASTEAVALNSALNMPAEWTIIGWIKTPIYGTMDNALIHSSDNHEHAICIHTGTGKAEVGNVSPTTDSGGSWERGTGYFLHDKLKNGWHQIAAVGTGGDGTAGTTKYYINGQYIGEAVLAGDNSTYKAYTAIGALGNNTGAGAHVIGTTIDEISIYNRPLSATEIRQFYGARLKYARAKDTSGGKFGIDAGDQVVIRFDGETSVTTPITADNIDTVLKLSNGHTWKDGNGQIGSIGWSTSTGGYANDTLTITLSTGGVSSPTVTNRDTIMLDEITIKDSNRAITGSIDIAGDFDGAVAYYDLDEGATITAADSINDNNGTLGGSTLPSWASGYSGSALNFSDSNTQYVTIPDSNNFNMTDYTIEAWVKLPTTIPSNYMRIISQESNTNPTNYWSLAVNPSGQLVHCDSQSLLTEMINTGNPPPYGAGEYDMGGLPASQHPRCETVTTKDLRDDKWHFVVVVRNTASGINHFRFYIDHLLEKTTALNTAGTLGHNIAGTIEIGRKNGYTGNPTSSEYFRGYIDNVAIYNYALIDEEVHLHHFLYPIEAWAAGSGTGGINAGDSITIVFNGETAATIIGDLAALNNALKLPTGKTWGTTFGSAVWSSAGGYSNDTLKVTFGNGANMAVGDTITLENVILDVHNNPISGSVTITGSFEVDVPIGAIAYWDFNENLGTSIDDKVGSYDGSIYGGVGNEWVAGKFGSALDLTGSTKYLSLTNSVPLTSNEWTIEAWFYGQLPTTGDIHNTLITEKNPGTQQIIQVNNSRQLGIYSTTDGGGFRSSGYTGIDSLSSTQWHHLVAVGKNSKTYFYIDGSIVGTYSNYQSSTSIDKIGNGRNTSAEFKRPWGKIDDIVIYKRALSPSEISQRAAR